MAVYTGCGPPGMDSAACVGKPNVRLATLRAWGNGGVKDEFGAAR